MSLKLVVTSDIHAHTWKAFGGGRGKDNVRFQQTLKILRDTLEKASELDALWVNTGDIIHTTGFSKHEVTSSIVEVLDKYPYVKKILIHGNHDSRGRGGKIEIEDTFQYVLERTLDNVYVLNYHNLEHEGYSIYGVGAQPDRSLYEFKEADIGLFHDFVKGAKLDSGVVLNEGIPTKTLFDNYRLSIVGDIHQPHLEEKDGRYILIPGSPEHHNFGYKGDRGWYVITMDEENIEIETIVSDSPKFLTVSTPEEVKDDGNFYRILGKVDKSNIPDNVKYISPSPTIVEERNVLSLQDGVDAILQKWLELNPPQGDSDQYLSIAKEILSEQELIVPQNHILESVEAENFNSYEHFRYEVDKGVTLVVGSSDRYNSNGTGKSSLFEAVFWCLLGKTTKGQAADDVIRRDVKQCRVEIKVKLSSGGRLSFVRERTPSLKVSASIDGEEISASTNKELEDKVLGILGLNEKLVKTLMYFSQDDLTLLSRASDAEIKNIISDLAGLTSYQEAATAANKKVGEIEEDVYTNSSIMLTTQRQLEQNIDNLKDVEDKIEEFNNKKKSRIQEIESDLETKKTDFLSYSNRSTNIVKERAERLLQRAKKTARKKAAASYKKVYRGKKKERTKVLEKLNKELEEITQEASPKAIREEPEVFEQEINNLTERSEKLHSKIRKVEEKKTELKRDNSSTLSKSKELKNKLHNYKQGICPECGQSVEDKDKTKEIEKDIQSLEEKLLKISSDLQKIEAYLSKCSLKEQELVEEISSARKNLKDCNKIIELNEKITSAENNIEETAKTHATATAKSIEKIQIEGRERVIKNRIKIAQNFLDNKVRDLKKEIERLEHRLEEELAQENPHIEYKTNTENRISKLEDDLSSLLEKNEKLEAQKNLYQYWTKGFGKSGIQSLLMDDIAGAFNQVRGNIFPTLTDGIYDVQFSTQSSTRSGDIRERLSFLVFEQGQEVPYAGLSGGEKRRIDLGVLLGMTAAICKSYGISGLLGIMVLDEVASFLDEDGAESVADTLLEYVDFAVPSIYIVSHDHSLQSLFNQKIEVVRKNGVSKINGK